MKSEDIFICKKCGDCCKGYGGTFVTGKDIEAISRYIKTDTESFVKNYCLKSGNKLVLAQKESGYCIFWDKLCTIHPVKPAMCRAWPFIQSVIYDVKNWHIMAAFCPGMRTDLSDDLIKEHVGKKILKGSLKD